MARKTTTRSTASTTTRTPKKPATTRSPKPAVAASSAVEPAATAAPATSADPVKVLGKRELIDRVVTASGIKKRAAKPVIEAVLMELGEAFSRGDTLNLQPFGKGITKNRKDLENAEVIEVRLRRSKTAVRASAQVRDPLAEAAE